MQSGDIMSNERKRRMDRIKEIHEIIDDFASKDLYSANCETVKYLYIELHRIEAELEGMEYEEPEEEDYTPQFIGGSDVPINGDYM